jgi:hypothetical protein
MAAWESFVSVKRPPSKSPVSHASRELTMLYKWTCYGVAGLSTLFGGLEYKIISPPVYDAIATFVATIAKSGFYDGAPNSFWNFVG